MRTLLLLIGALLLVPGYGQDDFPPAYPREGAEKVLENEHVIVWDISWLKQGYPVHRHRYPHTGVYYAPGDRIITSLEGEAREVHTDAWNISFQLSGVTHTETGISDAPLQAIFIQIKRDAGEPAVDDPDIAVFPDDNPLDRRSNERVRVWEYPPGYSATDSAIHLHRHDAVVVWFDAESLPNVHFIASGTRHAGEIPSSATRVFVFEIL